MISIVTIQQVSLVTYRMLVLQLSITLSGCHNDQPDCRRCFLQPHSGIEHLNCVTMLFMWSIIAFLDRVIGDIRPKLHFDVCIVLLVEAEPTTLIRGGRTNIMTHRMCDKYVHKCTFQHIFLCFYICS